MVVMWVVYVFASVLVIFVLSFISGMFGMNEKTSMNLEMYECGIEPIQDEKTPFYLHFFLIGVLFLLFDVELIVCIPMVWMNVWSNLIWSVVWFVFFFILFVGLALELVMGTFGWKE